MTMKLEGKKLKIGRKEFKNHMKLDISVKVARNYGVSLVQHRCMTIMARYIGNMTMQTDITELKRANEVLIDSEIQLHSVLEIAKKSFIG